jgi:hypothetical protein
MIFYDVVNFGILYNCSKKKFYRIIKAVPLLAWRSPEVSKNLRLPDFLITTQDVGKVVSLTHR